MRKSSSIRLALVMLVAAATGCTTDDGEWGPLAVYEDDTQGGLMMGGGSGHLVITDECVFLRLDDSEEVASVPALRRHLHGAQGKCSGVPTTKRSSSSKWKAPLFTCEMETISRSEARAEVGANRPRKGGLPLQRTPARTYDSQCTSYRS